jgi:hypothetical protein
MDNFGNTAGKLSRTPLGIIALFIVLVYGIAGLVLGVSGEQLQENHKTVLVWFLSIFPFSVLVAFTWLVSKHHTKLHSPSDFRNDDGFIRILSPEEQKKRIESEVREIKEAEKEQTSKPSATFLPSKNSEIMRAIILAEELAFRELEAIYNVSINRHVSIGVGYDTGIDGMFASSNQAYVVEIKYIKSRINLRAFENTIRVISGRLKNFNWKNFQIVFAVVLENEDLISKEEMIEASSGLVKVGVDLGVTVTPKIFLLSELKDKFGYAER